MIRCAGCLGRQATRSVVLGWLVAPSCWWCARRGERANEPPPPAHDPEAVVPPPPAVKRRFRAIQGGRQ